jgi:pimeloyl-ACP methyl ester carboxylesterase
MLIQEIGSFYAGGRTVTVDSEIPWTVEMSHDVPDYPYDPNGTYAIDHAYVSYVIPADSSNLPLVLVHGGGMTGACWETTPDGRPGWLSNFLRAGWPCYVVDNAERGRAGWCGLPGFRSGKPMMRSQQECWTTFRIGSKDGYRSRTTFPGNQFPAGALTELARQMVPRWTNAEERDIATLRAVVDRVGRCVLIGHSQGGGIAAHVASAAPEKVMASVLLEPHGLPPARREDATNPQLIVLGDNLEKSALTVLLAPLWGNYQSVRSDIGRRVDIMDLPRLGLSGNSHLMFADRNSDDVAGLIRGWIGTALTELG